MFGLFFLSISPEVPVAAVGALVILLNNLFIYFSDDAAAVRMSKSERTFIMIKPDGVQRGLVGEIIKRFEQKGFKLVAMKMVQVGYYYYRILFL